MVMMLLMNDISTILKSANNKKVKEAMKLNQSKIEALMKKRINISEEKQVLIDKIMSEFKQSKTLNVDMLKKLGLTKEAMEAIEKITTTMDGTGSLSMVDIMKDQLKSLNQEDIIQEGVEEVIESKAEDTLTDHKTDKDAMKSVSKARARQRS
jgi:transcriptional regulator with PAS, ATPase and Fis domain